MDDMARDNDDTSPVGLLAGWGRYPIIVAEALRKQNRRLACIGIKQHTDPRLRELCDDYVELGLGKIGAGLRFFQRSGVRTAMMAGKIHKVMLFQKLYWVAHLPDWQGARILFPYFVANTKDRKDDTLLGMFVNAFADAGVKVVPATDFVPELLVKIGNLTRRRPTKNEMKDIQFGWQLAKEIGRLDIGQSVAVKGRAVLAVEAVEGTDECIRRAGELCPAGGFTVVKVAKPQQDMRFDVPTIGVGTMESLVQAGARILAVESAKTILIDESEVLEFANQQQLCIVALAEESGQLPDAA
jgi:hypothetical protein